MQQIFATYGCCHPCFISGLELPAAARQVSSNSAAEKALMLVNLDNPEDRSVLDIQNMKKGHKLRLMAAILETCADQAQ